jgi:hypothetical protein
MPVFFIKKGNTAPTIVRPKSSKFDWSKWYEKNKLRLSEKRKKRYQEDEAYKNSIKERSKTQRKRVEDTEKVFIVTFKEASEQLQVSMWSLREWRKKDYYPEPQHRLGKLWFSQRQVILLQQLADFFKNHGIRTKQSDRDSLQSIIASIFANWAETSS